MDLLSFRSPNTCGKLLSLLLDLEVTLNLRRKIGGAAALYPKINRFDKPPTSKALRPLR